MNHAKVIIMAMKKARDNKKSKSEHENDYEENENNGMCSKEEIEKMIDMKIKAALKGMAKNKK